MRQKKFDTWREAEDWLSAMGWWQDTASDWHKGSTLVATVYDNGLVEISKT